MINSCVENDISIIWVLLFALLCTTLLAIGNGLERLICYILYQGQMNGQPAENEPFEAECTCDGQNSKCDHHDIELLSKISNIVTSYGDMMDLGWGLNIKSTVIAECHKNNITCIKSAVLEMLEIWYQGQPDFKANSKAVVKLKDALTYIGKAVHCTEIIDEHFENK